MSAFRYTVSRRSIVEEIYTVEADSEEEAIELISNGAIDYDNDMISTDFVDWYDDNWEITGKEDLCPLVKMIKKHAETTTS